MYHTGIAVMDLERWRQVEQVYHSAAELDPDDREQFLAEACKDDKELQDSVQTLLDEEPSTTELLGEPLWKLAEDSLTDSCASALAPDLQLGPYHIEAILGAGRHGRGLPGAGHTSWPYGRHKGA